MKKRLVFALALFVLLLFPSICSANDRYQWVVSNDKKGIFFDTETIKYGYNQYQKTVDKTQINVWTKYIYSDAGIQNEIESRKRQELPVKGFEHLWYTLEHLMVSRDGRIRLLGYVHYAKDGTTIYSYSSLNPTWTEIVPDSFGEYIYQAVWAYSYDTTNSITMRLRAER